MQHISSISIYMAHLCSIREQQMQRQHFSLRLDGADVNWLQQTACCENSRTSVWILFYFFRGGSLWPGLGLANWSKGNFQSKKRHISFSAMEYRFQYVWKKSAKSSIDWTELLVIAMQHTSEASTASCCYISAISGWSINSRR